MAIVEINVVCPLLFYVWGWQMILSDLITLCLGVIVTVIWSKPINSLFKEES